VRHGTVGRFHKAQSAGRGGRPEHQGGAAQDKEALKATVDEARKSADDLSADLLTKAQEATGEAERSWDEVKSNWDQHVKRIRERVDARKADLDAGFAERDAQWAEVDARDAINFAAAAIDEAEYAVLAAAEARVEADTLASST
jgi:small-conductance mechanosensitive channel